MKNRSLSRRQFMRQAVPAAAGTAVFFFTGCRPKPAPTTILRPPQAPLEIVITPNEEFYVMTSNGTPTPELSDWTLTIDGAVDNPLTLTWADIIAQPKIEQMRTLECIGNAVGGNKIGNAIWSGCLLAPLLTRLGIREEAWRAIFSASDGYSTSVTVDWLLQPDTLLAYEMNGRQLSPDHGYPLRIFIPGLYGQKMPKWLTRIEFSLAKVHLGLWEKQGWSNIAAVKTKSIIQNPMLNQQLPPTVMEIFGVAYAGGRSITAVEIGFEQDGQTEWQQVDRLVHGVTPEVWTQFSMIWTPPRPGAYSLLVRASDETGFVQSERARGFFGGAFPDGTEKIHDIEVVIR